MQVIIDNNFNKVFHFLQTPFPRPEPSRKNILLLVLVTIISGLFILIFKPFNIENQTGEWFIYLIIFSLGVVFSLSLYFMEFFIPRLFPKIFSRWNLGKALLWYPLVILFVSGVMFLYKSFLGGFRDFTALEFVMVSGRVLGIGVVVSFFTLGAVSYLNRKQFALLSSREQYTVKIPHSKSISINLAEVMFIVSDDNYVEIHSETNGIRKS